MSDRSPEEIKRFIDGYRGNIERFRGGFEQRSLMYGGSLNGVEAAWNVLTTMEEFLNGVDIYDRTEGDLSFKAYSTVAEKYKCGNWVISAKVKEEMGEGPEAALELIRRLREVDDLLVRLRAERAAK
jgi:hypothetical protein